MCLTHAPGAAVDVRGDGAAALGVVGHHRNVVAVAEAHEELPEEARNDLEFAFLDEMQDILYEVLEPVTPAASGNDEAKTNEAQPA